MLNSSLQGIARQTKTNLTVLVAPSRQSLGNSHLGCKRLHFLGFLPDKGSHVLLNCNLAREPKHLRYSPSSCQILCRNLTLKALRTSLTHKSVSFSDSTSLKSLISRALLLQHLITIKSATQLVTQQCWKIRFSGDPGGRKGKHSVIVFRQKPVCERLIK